MFPFGNKPRDASRTDRRAMTPLLEEPPSIETELPERDGPVASRRPTMTPDGRADLSLLEDKLPEWLKAPKAWAWLSFALGLAYFLFSRMRIYHTDVWGHLAYGRWIVDHRALPLTEPLLTLAKGVPWVDTAWLSKVTGYEAFSWFGIAGLQFIHAVTLTAAFAAITLGVYRKTRGVASAILALATFILVDYQQLIIQRPQDVGLACFAVTFVLAMSLRPRWSDWVVIPALFAVWANFHGSFPCGLLVLLAVAAGRAIDLWRKTGRLSLALKSGLAWKPLLLAQLAAAAALLNPHGLGIYADILTISRNPNLEALIDWDPLTLRMWQGQAFALVCVALCGAYRFSPRRVSAAEVLLLVGFGGLSLWTLRMIAWWGPLAGYFLALHAAAAWRQRVKGPVVAPAPERRGLWSVVTVGLVWIFFAYSPFGLERIHGRPQGKEAAEALRRGVSDRTPLAVVEYLREHADELPGGQMYNSQEWGDYLQWAAPAKFQVFANSHVHVLPSEVWEDFLQICQGRADWEDKLDRYGVNTVLVDTTNYDGLVRALREQPGWQEVYQDPQGLGVLFVRRKPV